MRCARLHFAVVFWAIAGVIPARGAENDGAEFFEKRVRPLLAEKCFSCHSTDGPKLKGGLRLDARSGLIKGGDGGPVIVAGKPADSRLIHAVKRLDPDSAMPPKPEHALSEREVADLEAWVQMGAPDPRQP